MRIIIERSRCTSYAAETRIVSSSWDEPAGCLMTGPAATGRHGPAGAIIALAGIAAVAAFMRRHTGMEVGLALCLIAVVELVGVVWVVFALVAVAVVAGG